MLVGLLRATRPQALHRWSLILPVLLISEFAEAPKCLSGPIVDVTAQAPSLPAGQYLPPATQTSQGDDFASPILDKPDPEPSQPTTIVDSYGAKHLKRMLDQTAPEPSVASAELPPPPMAGDPPVVVTDGVPVVAPQVAAFNPTALPPTVGSATAPPEVAAAVPDPPQTVAATVGSVPPGEVPATAGEEVPEPSALWILPCCVTLAVSRRRFFWL